LGSGDSLSINGVQLSGFAVQKGDADGSLVREINAVSALTGVTASRNDEGLVELSAEDGRNIAIQAQGAGASLGFVDGAIQGGQLTLSSTKSYSLRFSSSGVNDQALGGIARSTSGGGGAGSPSLNSSIISGGEVVFSSPPGPPSPVSYAQDNSRFNASAEITSITGAYVSGGGFANPQDFYGYYQNNKMFIAPDNAGTPNFGAAQQSNGISGSNTFTINGASFSINYATANIDSNSGGDKRVSAFKFRLSEATVGGGAVEALMSKRLDQNHVASIDISSARGARRAIGIIDVALEEVNYYRGQLGATQNRLSSMVNNFEQARFDLSAAHSRINDADFAQELSALSSSQVIQQAGVSVISQANASFATALNLLSTGVESAEGSALYS
jgi:flagellin